MNVCVCLIAVCIAVVHCDVKERSYGQDKAYGSEKEYRRENKHRYESDDKSYGNNGDGHNKNAYGLEKEHGKENKYGHESHDTSYARGGDYGHERNDYGKDKSHDIEYKKQSIYHGKYEGHCNKDGFYYGDHSTFIICSNNNAYVQPCAPGSRNSGFDNYNYGDHLKYRDFCDVNLVDNGFGLKGTFGQDQNGDQGYNGDNHYRGAHDAYEHKSYSHQRHDSAY